MKPRIVRESEAGISTHQLGSCRMGNDPVSSVADRTGRVHGVPNVYIADGSLLEPSWEDNYRGVFNLPGVPAMSIPAGFDDRGLPLGVQLIGPRLGEAAVLAAGHAFQSVTDWHRRRPPLGGL